MKSIIRIFIKSINEILKNADLNSTVPNNVTQSTANIKLWKTKANSTNTMTGKKRLKRLKFLEKNSQS